jgi:hypothetical protein
VASPGHKSIGSVRGRSTEAGTVSRRDGELTPSLLRLGAVTVDTLEWGVVLLIVLVARELSG